MSKKLFALLLLLVGTSINQMFAQCTPPEAERCEDAAVFCSYDDLNGYQCQNNSTRYSDCNLLCSLGGISHNTGWWAFVTDGGNVNLTLEILSCFTGQGLQFGIWGDCGCSEEIACQSIPCIASGTFTLNFSLQACKTYYLWVDGCDGDVCDFRIRTSGGSKPRLSPLESINDDADRKVDLCQGQCNYRFRVPPQPGGCSPTYVWELDGSVVGDNSNEIFLDFPDEGTFRLCVTAYIGNPQTGSICEQEGPECMTINVRRRPDRLGTKRTLCFAEVPFKWHSALVTASGMYIIEFEDSNCCVFDSVVEFIIKIDSIELVGQDRSICEREIPYSWGILDIQSEGLYKKRFINNDLCVAVDSIVRFAILRDDQPPCNNKPYIRGRVYMDNNKNFVFDGGDDLLSNRMVISNQGSNVSFTDKFGYALSVVPNIQNTISTILPNPQNFIVRPLEYKVMTNATFGLIPGQYDFAIIKKDAVDLRLNIYAGIARPGFPFIVTITVSNDANDVSDLFAVNLAVPPGWQVSSIDPMPFNIINDTITWHYDKPLLSWGQISFTCLLTPPTNLVDGTRFSLFSSVSILNDIKEKNNQAIWASTLRRSYDPNDKLVNYILIKDSLAKDDALIYTIRFQNTGSDTAIHVFIRDTLDPLLDARTFQLLHSSHPVRLIASKLGIYEFRMSNIYLPDSTADLRASQGFIQYAVQPNRQFIRGTKINNSASIYFDFNDPVKTNTISTHYQILEGLNDLFTDMFKVYPNPFDQEIWVDIYQLNNFKNLNLVLLDNQGKELDRWAVAPGGKQRLNTRNLVSGSYNIVLMSVNEILDMEIIIKN